MTRRPRIRRKPRQVDEAWAYVNVKVKKDSFCVLQVTDKGGKNWKITTLENMIILDSFHSDQKCLCEEPDEAVYVTNVYHQGVEVTFCPLCCAERREIDFEETDTSPEEDADKEKWYEIDTELQISKDNIKINSPDLAANLHPGSHIAWVRWTGKRFIPKTYSHHAVVEESDDRYLQIVHYAIDVGRSKVIQIHRQRLPLTEVGYDNFYLINYPQRVTRQNPPPLVLERAHSRLGERLYNPFTNNCESFVNFCKTGFSHSLQVTARLESFVKKLRNTLSSFSKKSKVVMWTSKLLTKTSIESSFRSSEDSRPRVIEETLYVVSEGILCSSDMISLYQERKDISMNRKQFEERLVSELTFNLAEFLIIAAAAVAGGAFGFASGVSTGAAMGTIVPGVGNIVGGIAGGFMGYVGGRAFVETMRSHRWGFSERETITSVEKLRIGNHIVQMDGTVSHESCHGIVTDIKKIQKKISVIRYVKGRGVIEHQISFECMIRVNYAFGECYPAREVVKRVRRQLTQPPGQGDQGINCALFAANAKKRRR